MPKKSFAVGVILCIIHNLHHNWPCAPVAAAAALSGGPVGQDTEVARAGAQLEELQRLPGELPGRGRLCDYRHAALVPGLAQTPSTVTAPASI